MTLQVTPKVQFAPGKLKIQVSVAPQAKNRNLQVIGWCEGMEFRSSLETLDGEKADVVHYFEWKDVPGCQEDIVITAATETAHASTIIEVR